MSELQRAEIEEPIGVVTGESRLPAVRKDQKHATRITQQGHHEWKRTQLEMRSYQGRAQCQNPDQQQLLICTPRIA